MAHGRRYFAPALAAVALYAGLPGCTSAGSELARDENRKIDCLSRCGEDLEKKSVPPTVTRSQAPPEVLPPTPLTVPGRATVGEEPPGKAVVIGDPIVAPPTPAPVKAPVIVTVGATTPAPTPPTSLTTPVAAAAPAKIEGDTQVRIVASIGNNPIYESEVKEAVYQRLGELLRLGETARAAREKEMSREELKRIIERELVLDEMTANLTSRKQTSALTKLKEAAAKEADANLKAFKKERGIADDETFKAMLRSQGLSLSGIRRQIERGTMMRIYLQEKFGQRLDGVELIDVREYYDSHPSDFLVEERVRWQDLFVMADQFKTADEAKEYAKQMALRAQRGDDFNKLAEQYGYGDTKIRRGVGIGEKPGEIFPPELEPTLMKMKAGQVAIHPTETGYHIMRMAERTVAGRRPLDEKLQVEIRRKIQAQIFEKESRRLVETLWKRIQPQIWVDY